MSLFHYIGASRPLPLGKHGGVKSEDEHQPSCIYVFRNGNPPYAVPLELFLASSEIREEDIEVYDSMAEVAGVSLWSLHEENILIKKHFMNPYVYEITPNWGSFTLTPKFKEQDPYGYLASLKCVETLFQLMRDYGNEGDEFEIYSCWYNEEEESKKRSLRQIIELNAFTIPEDFQLENRQYIRVKL